MSVDLRPRRGSRAYVRALADFKPAKMRGCFGGITPGPGIIVGGSIGQVPEAQIPSTNILLDTESPGGVQWGGTAGFGNNGSAAQWDAGFFATAINAPTGVENMQSAIIGAQQNTQYTLSGQFSVNAALLAAIGLFATPASISVTFGVIWAGGAGRVDSITFNPATGVISAVSAGLSNVAVKTFSATLANGTQILVTQVSFTTSATPAGTNQAIVNILPSVGQAGQVAGGGFQLEVGAIATSFIPTSTFAKSSRALGKSARQQTDLGANPIIISINSVRQGSFDTGQIYIVTNNGVSFGFGAIPDNDGDWFDVFFTGTTLCTLNSALPVVGAGLPTAGVTSLTLPYDGVTPTGGSGPYNVCGARFIFSAALNQWIMSAIAEAHGALTFLTNGTYTPGTGVTAAQFSGCGAGGGGGGAAANAANGSAAGGGGGGQALSPGPAFRTVTPGTGIAITIGGAGTGGAAGANNGVAGGSTIVGALFTLSGGGLGNGAASGAIGNAGVGGNLSQSGNSGQLVPGTIAISGDGGGTFYGSPRAGWAVGGASSIQGFTAAGFGAGGSGAASGPTGAAAAGGNGASGFARVAW